MNLIVLLDRVKADQTRHIQIPKDCPGTLGISVKSSEWNYSQLAITISQMSLYFLKHQTIIWDSGWYTFLNLGAHAWSSLMRQKYERHLGDYCSPSPSKKALFNVPCFLSYQNIIDKSRYNLDKKPLAFLYISAPTRKLKYI